MQDPARELDDTHEAEGIIPLEPEDETPPPPRPHIDPNLPPPSAATKLRIQAESQRLEHEAYHLPAVLLAVGLLCTLVLTPIRAIFDPAVTPLPLVALGVYMLAFVLGLGLGLLLFELCSAFGIVTEAPWKLTALRLAASFAVADAIGVALAYVMPVELTLISDGLALLAFYFFIRALIDLEFQDAAVVALTLYLPKFFIELWLEMQFGLIA